ncbi:udp-glucose 4-epimerase [Nannochloropsis gaditana]|uniref:UDP-glucose 4-epimerase n=1 Tax=Nannochloropsis gaditana TaxID=72520 RepID=W7UAK8_9STRA|nr:udp-glucose 4-epimerase [Nannochloropsis gaditana]
MVTAMEKASGRKINYVIGERRPGDLDEVYSDPSKAERELGWKATRGLDDMTRDLWRWQQQNPQATAEGAFRLNPGALIAMKGRSWSGWKWLEGGMGLELWYKGMKRYGLLNRV